MVHWAFRSYASSLNTIKAKINISSFVCARLIKANGTKYIYRSLVLTEYKNIQINPFPNPYNNLILKIMLSDNSYSYNTNHKKCLHKIEVENLNFANIYHQLRDECIVNRDKVKTVENIKATFPQFKTGFGGSHVWISTQDNNRIAIIKNF